MSGAALGDEWVVRDAAATARRQPEHAIDNRQAVQIASGARRIAVARGTPQDVEWAIDAVGTLWILQARPMTSVPPDASWAAPALSANVPPAEALAANRAKASGFLKRFREQPLAHWINGRAERGASADLFDNLSPVDGSVLGQVVAGDERDVAAAA